MPLSYSITVSASRFRHFFEKRHKNSILSLFHAPFFTFSEKNAKKAADKKRCHTPRYDTTYVKSMPRVQLPPRPLPTASGMWEWICLKLADEKQLVDDKKGSESFIASTTGDVPSAPADPFCAGGCPVAEKQAGIAACGDAIGKWGLPV